MPTQILMPALSPTMTEGTLARWIKSEGDSVEPGDIIAEVETDKATMEIEAVDEGVLGRILVAEGAEGVAINTPIAVLVGEGEDAAAAAPPPAGNGAPPPPSSAAAAPAPPSPPPPAAPEGRIFASPLAKRMAAQAGIDLAALSGSGPRGRVVKRDIEAALDARAAAPPQPEPAAPPAAPAPAPPAGAVEIPNSGMRKTIAKRLAESKRTIPHFYLTVDCEIDALLKTRADLNARSDAYRLSVNDFVVRAAALALRRVPEANAAWTDAATLRHTTVDVAVAVAVEGGLVTPVVRGADNKGLAEISAEMADFAARARAGKLLPEEYQGGGFSISNLGMYGVREFAAVINPPQAGILAVGAGEQRPAVRDGALAVATVMTCTLSGDHRVIDGAIGARFLAAFKGLVEDPLTMLL